MTAGEGEIATEWVEIPSPLRLGDLPFIPTVRVTLEAEATGARHRLRLLFDWQQDRHQLQIWRDVEAAGEVASELLLTSDEGTAHNRWPPSPPLQSLAIEERGEQAVALAVGMAGGAHWSASIETLPEPLAFRFDYACRLNEQPEFLGTTFGVAPTIAEDAISAIDLAGGQLEMLRGRLRITADAPVASSSVLTARWHFTLKYLPRVHKKGA